jgi:hypothetical protein
MKPTKGVRNDFHPEIWLHPHQVDHRNGALAVCVVRFRADLQPAQALVPDDQFWWDEDEDLGACCCAQEVVQKRESLNRILFFSHSQEKHLL